LFYSIANPKIIQACTLMREVLVEQYKTKEIEVSRLVKAFNYVSGKRSVKRKTAAKRK
jgi:hypothetical protein